MTNPGSLANQGLKSLESLSQKSLERLSLKKQKMRFPMQFPFAEDRLSNAVSGTSVAFASDKNNSKKRAKQQTGALPCTRAR